MISVLISRNLELTIVLCCEIAINLFRRVFKSNIKCHDWIIIGFLIYFVVT